MKPIENIKVGIVGGTGYTGVELLRLLARHPRVDIVAITSRSEAGREVHNLFPSLRGVLPHCFVLPDNATLSGCDLVFFATPNGIAMRQVPELLEAGVRVIDLAADFRLQDPALWEKWYGIVHACPKLLDEAVYGLPEFNRRQISKARLVANPGCYPTAVQLGFMPLIEKKCVDMGGLIADVKSGVSGAGRNVREDILYAEVAESFRAYGVAGHRHLPEIVQGLSKISGVSEAVNLTFVPHLVPMTRGIHATLYATLSCHIDLDLQALYEDYYHKEMFVDVLPAGAHPETRSVSGANHCRIAVHRPQGGETVVILSVIDNLVKGAAGQAIQNMNIMFGLAESTGLEVVPLCP